MSVNLDQMLIQCLFVLCPILLSQALRWDILIEEGSKKHQYVVGLLNGLAAVLCQAHPLSIGSAVFDFKWIPFMLSILYGNVRAWLVTAVLLLGYRVYLGGPGMRAPFLAAIVISVLIWLCRRWYIKASRNKKTVLGALFVLFFYTLFLSLMVYGRGVRAIQTYYLLDGLLYVAGMVCCILLVENQRDSIRMRREVERSEKLSLISELAASVAHEIRNPLTVARGFIQLAKEDLDERKQHYMETVITELDRTDFIISDFLNFSKPQLDRIEVIDVEHLIVTVCNIMQPFAMMHDVDLVVQADPDVRILGDDAKLKQAIMNLVKNSIEAMPHGGRITISIEMVDGQVAIRVQDTGEGMSHEQMQRLGQPFYSTKDKGTGLGLMVTFRLVEAMHGKLTFHSEMNKGTEATLLFPKSTGKTSGKREL